MQYKRADRVAALLKEEISQIMLREVHDPDLGFVTVTNVRISSDLKHAKVYYSVLGDEEKKLKSAQAIERAQKNIRSLVGQRIRLRSVPTIQFFYDDTGEYAERINRIINRLNSGE